MHTEPQLCFVECPMPPEAAAGKAPRHMAYWNWAPHGNGQADHAVVCVHGLSRQGRDFDTLARALQPHVRVVCPDVAGRGRSDWLADPMHYQLPTYANDMVALLAQLRREGVTTVDWVGTSMGGLIGMALASQPAIGFRRLVLNDVGPAIEASALQRIGTYLGVGQVFTSEQEGADYLWSISTSFGPHTPQQWLALSAPMLRQQPGGWHLHYDPAIAVPFKAITPELAAQGEAMLWYSYEQLRCPTLLIRGGQSDLLTEETAQAMTQRGPKAELVVFDEAGHAPTLVQPHQVAAVREFLLRP